MRLCINSLLLSILAALVITIISLIIGNYCRISDNSISKIISKIIMVGYSIPAAFVAISVILLFVNIDRNLKWLYLIIEPEKRGIGMVFQDYALFPHMTVEKNVLFGVKNIDRKEKEILLDKVLDLVDMKDFKKRYPHELSGGQQQRIAIARALAPNPALLLLDEPFSNLDANLKLKIRNEIKDILKKSKATSIFVTHDIDDAKEVADRIVLL